MSASFTSRPGHVFASSPATPRPRSVWSVLRSPVLDEPGAWETVGGQLMYDALTTAQGKPGSPLKLVFIGTLGPEYVWLLARP